MDLLMDCLGFPIYSCRYDKHTQNLLSPCHHYSSILHPIHSHQWQQQLWSKLLIELSSPCPNGCVGPILFRPSRMSFKEIKYTRYLYAHDRRWSDYVPYFGNWFKLLIFDYEEFLCSFDRKLDRDWNVLRWGLQVCFRQICICVHQGEFIEFGY